MAAMKYLPLFVRLAGRRCLIVGGGAVAAGRARLLLDAGATVVVISPELCDELQSLADRARIAHEKRRYRSGDVAGFFLVLSATGIADVDARVAVDARRAGVIVNVADRIELCDFIVPAVVQRDDLIVAISTSGASPAMARRLRHELEEQLGREYGVAVQLLGRLRRRLKSTSTPAADRARILRELVESPLLDLLRQGRLKEIDSLLAKAAGEQVSLASLDIHCDRSS